MRARSQPPIPDRDHAPLRARPAARTARGAVQTKLTLGPPGDRYEREADSVARQVVASISPPAVAQRQPEEEELLASRVQRQPEEEELMASRVQRQPEEEELMAKRVQRQPEEEDLLQGKLQFKAGALSGGAEPGPVDPAIERQIQSSRSGGRPLDAGVRASMESAFGAGFEGVRVHTGQAADDLNSSLQARAFTSGRDIFFRQGDYDPGSRAGQELIAHELTHVVQQGEATETAAG